MSADLISCIVPIPLWGISNKSLLGLPNTYPTHDSILKYRYFLISRYVRFLVIFHVFEL